MARESVHVHFGTLDVDTRIVDGREVVTLHTHRRTAALCCLILGLGAVVCGFGLDGGG
jgi:hypothetical protein